MKMLSLVSQERSAVGVGVRVGITLRSGLKAHFAQLSTSTWMLRHMDLMMSTYTLYSNIILLLIS